MGRKIAFAAILLISFILRFINIQGRGIWYDDAFSIFLSRVDIPYIVAGTAADTMPPLYYVLLHGWMKLFGEEIWVLRFLNILLWSLCLLLIFLIIKKILNDESAIATGLLSATSPFLIYHAQELRMYILLLLGQLGYIYIFINIYRNNSNKVFWGYLILFGCIAMYTHNLAIIGCLVPNIFLVIKRQWRLLFKLLAAQMVIGILFIPWLLFLPQQIEKIQRAFWTPLPGLVEILQSLVQITVTLPLPGTYLLAGLFLSLLIFTIIFIETYESRFRDESVLFLFILFLVPPIMMFMISYLMRPIFITRGFILSAIAYYGLAGWIIAQSQNKWAGRLLMISFICSPLIALPYEYFYDQFPRSPFQGVSNYLNLIVERGDIVIHDNKLSFFPVKYYSREVEQEQYFMADIPWSHNDTLALQTQEAMGIFAQLKIEEAVGNSQQIYFVVFSRAINEAIQLGFSDPPNLLWLKQKYLLVDRRLFGDLEVYHFTR